MSLMTENDFREGVRYLEKIDPEHPILPTLKRVGYSLLNVEYLIFAFRKKQGLRKPGALTKKNLNVKKARLYANRAKLSNGFHEAISQAERAMISDQIREIQKQIAFVDEQIQYLEKHPDRIVTPEFMDLDIPGDLEGKRKMLHGLRVKARAARKRAAQYKAEGREKMYLKNIKRAEKQEKQIKYVEQKIDQSQFV